MGQPSNEPITHVIAQRFKAGRQPPHVPAPAWHVAPCATPHSWPHPTRNVVLVKSLDLVSGASEDRAWLRDDEAYVVTILLSKQIQSPPSYKKVSYKKVDSGLEILEYVISRLCKKVNCFRAK